MRKAGATGNTVRRACGGENSQASGHSSPDVTWMPECGVENRLLRDCGGCLRGGTSR